MEADRAVASFGRAPPVQRAAAPGDRHQREDVDPATARDGGGRNRQPEGLSRDPPARRVCPDRVRRLALGGPPAAMRLGSRAHGTHRGSERRSRLIGSEENGSHGRTCTALKARSWSEPAYRRAAQGIRQGGFVASNRFTLSGPAPRAVLRAVSPRSEFLLGLTPRVCFPSGCEK